MGSTNLMPENHVLHPVGNKLLVLRDESPEESSIIIVPEFAKTPALSGTVAAVGPDVTQVAVGDNVVFGQYVGSNIRVERHTYVCVKEEDIHIIIKEKQK